MALRSHTQPRWRQLKPHCNFHPSFLSQKQKLQKKNSIVDFFDLFSLIITKCYYRFLFVSCVKVTDSEFVKDLLNWKCKDIASELQVPGVGKAV